MFEINLFKKVNIKLILNSLMGQFSVFFVRENLLFLIDIKCTYFLQSYEYFRVKDF